MFLNDIRKFYYIGNFTINNINYKKNIPKNCAKKYAMLKTFYNAQEYIYKLFLHYLNVNNNKEQNLHPCID